MGIGYLRIVDRDIVSRSDHHRQHLYDVESVGMPKVEIAQQKLNRLNPDVKIEAIPESLNSINAKDIISGMDREFEFNIIDMQSVDNCRVCGKNPDGPPEEITDRLFEETCARHGRRNFVLSPNRRISIDLDKLTKVLKKKQFRIQSVAKLGTTFNPSEDIQTCLLKSGIMIAQTPPDAKADIKEKVFEIYRAILVDNLGLPPDILPQK
jgi:hypothetical protein